MRWVSGIPITDETPSRASALLQLIAVSRRGLVQFSIVRQAWIGPIFHRAASVDWSNFPSCGKRGLVQFSIVRQAWIGPILHRAASVGPFNFSSCGKRGSVQFSIVRQAWVRPILHRVANVGLFDPPRDGWRGPASSIVWLNSICRSRLAGEGVASSALMVTG